MQRWNAKGYPYSKTKVNALTNGGQVQKYRTYARKGGCTRFRTAEPKKRCFGKYHDMHQCTTIVLIIVKNYCTEVQALIYIERMEYTVKEIADQTGTYKVRVERYLKANSIEPEYVLGGRNTKYYSEQVMLDYIDFIKEKEQEENNNNATEIETLKDSLELKRENRFLTEQLKENQKQIEHLNATIELISSQNNERISDLKDGMETLKAELRNKNSERNQQNQTIEILMSQNKKLLELLEQAKQQQTPPIAPEAIGPDEKIEEEKKPVKTSKKGILERIFKHE